MSASEPKLLAFLFMAVNEKEQSMRGGCLVTDPNTLPIELKVTTTIRPTPVQIASYGRKLTEYMFRDLVGDRLIKSLTTQPAAFFTMQPDFLRIREFSDVPVFLVSQADNEFSISTALGYESDSEIVDELLQNINSKEMVQEPFLRIRTLLKQVKDVEVEE